MVATGNNAYTNTSKVAAEALRLLANNLQYVKMINQKYSKTFKAPESIGDTLRIRVPFNPGTRDGNVASFQDFVEQYRTLTIDTQKGSDLKFSSLEKELDIKEFSDRCLRNEMTNLAAVVEADCMSDHVNKCSNVITSSGIDQDQIREAYARHVENLTPMDKRLALFVNPKDQTTILKGTEQLFHAGKALEDQFMDGKLGDLLGYKVYCSNLIPNLETGTNTNRTVAVATNVTEGATSIALSGLSASSTVKAGEVFSIADVKAVNYQLKTNQSHDKQFVVLADATADGAGAVTVLVGEIFEGGGTALVNGKSVATDTLQNVSQLPVATDVVVFIGAASSTYPQNIAFHPDYATVAFVDPEVPRDNNRGAKYTMEGIGMRYVEFFDGVNDKYPHRFDVYYGKTMLWEQWGIRIVSI